MFYSGSRGKKEHKTLKHKGSIKRLKYLEMNPSDATNRFTSSVSTFPVIISSFIAAIASLVDALINPFRRCFRLTFLKSRKLISNHSQEHFLLMFSYAASPSRQITSASASRDPNEE